MKKTLIALLLMLPGLCGVSAAPLLVEAESFAEKGGWVVDQQFMDRMGSSYLLAHGAGTPVAPARTDIEVSDAGTYRVWVRTYNWTSPWTAEPGPGKFRVRVGRKLLPGTVGHTGSCWEWQCAGEVRLAAGRTTLALEDLTGFDGRCDALYLTDRPDDVPPADAEALAAFRRELAGQPAPREERFDFVVVGGGIAGMCAAVSAAREGCGRVALVNDRPVLGGNNSAEVRVHLGGYVETGRYPMLGRMIREFGHTKAGNAQPAANYEDDRKQRFIDAEPNVTLWAPYRALDVRMEGSKIAAVLVRHIETGEEIWLSAPLFSDCTGDGTIGYLAGADWRMGREARSEFGEELAPEKADSMTMGASVQWYSSKVEKSRAKFPEFSYGVVFNEENCEPVTFGEWKWETGLNRNQITEAERIRDYGLLVIYSNWSFLKNHYSQRERFADRNLDWVGYISGKRESRRLLGDYILKQDDIDKDVFHEDASFTTTWAIDLHSPDRKNAAHFPEDPFKAATVHNWIKPYAVPYRCLYSRNVENLFMAGRNISVTHVALGTVRVMRTTGMMGEVVGMAAAICHRNGCLPRGVYQDHLTELQEAMERGASRPGAELNNQNFNLPNKLLDQPAGIAGHR